MQKPSNERVRSIGSAAAWVFAPLLATLVVASAVPAMFHARLPDAPPLHQRWMATPTTVERLRANGITPVFSGLKLQVIEVMQATGLHDRIGPENIYRTDDGALAHLRERVGPA